MASVVELRERLESVRNSHNEQSSQILANTLMSELRSARDEELREMVGSLRAQGITSRQLQVHPNIKRIHAKYGELGLQR